MKSNFDKEITIFNIFERFIALVLIIILAPIWVLIAIIIKIDSKGKVLFIQKRIGKDSNIFYMYKFRTMLYDSPISIPSNEIESTYITRIGKYLRKTSLDELPQLINIAKGEMSFIGYRPVIPEETTLISIRKKYNIDKNLPGITGWAQINGRDKVSIDKKAELDKYYYENRSIAFNIKIIFFTVYKVITIDGIYN